MRDVVKLRPVTGGNWEGRPKGAEATRWRRRVGPAAQFGRAASGRRNTDKRADVSARVHSYRGGTVGTALDLGPTPRALASASGAPADTQHRVQHGGASTETGS